MADAHLNGSLNLPSAEAAAGHCQREFGVATDCGMGRKPCERVPELLEIQARVRV